MITVEGYEMVMFKRDRAAGCVCKVAWPKGPKEDGVLTVVELCKVHALGAPLPTPPARVHPGRACFHVQ